MDEATRIVTYYDCQCDDASDVILRLDQWAEAGIEVRGDVGSVPAVTFALQETQERVVLDLHVGDAFERDHQFINMPSEFVLRPGESIRLRTHEGLTTPKAVFGLICSRASLAAQGFYVSNIKVDPCFSGILEVAVFNGGRRPISITRGMAFASVFFARLDEPLPQEVRRTPTPTAGLAFTNWKERLRVASPFIATGSFAFIAAVVAALLLEALR